jgi:hypothetical protein
VVVTGAAAGNLSGRFYMTVNEGIRQLSELRESVGGDAPLLMADGLDVTRFNLAGDGSCVFVSDAPSPEEDAEDQQLFKAEEDYLMRAAEADSRAECPGW